MPRQWAGLTLALVAWATNPGGATPVPGNRPTTARLAPALLSVDLTDLTGQSRYVVEQRFESSLSSAFVFPFRGSAAVKCSGNHCACPHNTVCVDSGYANDGCKIGRAQEDEAVAGPATITG